MKPKRKSIFLFRQVMVVLVCALCPMELLSMVLVPAQTFMMGDQSTMGRCDQRPVHSVTLSSYYISAYMVTAQEYCDFLNDTSCAQEKEGFLFLKGKELSSCRDQGEVLLNFAYSPLTVQNGKFVPRPNCGRQPIYQVTWEGAAWYCNYRSRKEGLTPCYDPDKRWFCDFSADGYHLPTEAQWECAARGGHSSRLYPWGETISDQNTNYNNHPGRIVDVGSYPPNDYGLYDMPGNVMEWCHDWYKFDSYADCPSGVQNPTGPFRPNYNGGGMPVRVIRGGAYYHPAGFLTCAHRYGTADTKGCFSFNSFRLARQAVVDPTSLEPDRPTQGSPAEINKTKEWLNTAWASASGGQPDSASLPFSFVLDDTSSSTLLSRWKIATDPETSAQGKQVKIYRFTDPESKLEIACEVTTFEQYPAVDMVLHITNRGTDDSGILENVCVLDHAFHRVADEKREFILRHSRGSRADEFDFFATDELLSPQAQYALGGHGGRPSDYDLPFMNLSWGSGGAVLAVGWSGQWRATFQRDSQRGLTVKTGMEYMHLRLHPGESIRTPRMLLVFWEGENMLRGHNLFRQLILAHYSPRIDGQPIVAPFAASVGPYTEEVQVTAASKLAKAGLEAQWIDAGWFKGGWPFGAGNWVPDPSLFPHGLSPVGDAVHAAGMKFLLWFEIERVSRGSRLDREHPEWVIGPVTEYGGLLNWGIPEARQWITDLVSQQITAGKVDIFRQDFNMEPLMYWLRNDSPDRQGMTEIRFVEGMYLMWDELRRRHPGLWIDNCASGGRMIDLETTMRAITLTQSDGPVIRYSDIMNQAQNHGLNFYLPIHSPVSFGLEPSYKFRSSMTTGGGQSYDLNNLPEEDIRRTAAVYQQVRPYFEGDYYPLFESRIDEMQWFGYQLNRPDEARGMIVVFRRKDCTEDTVSVYLNAIDRQAQYDLTEKDSGQTRSLSGKELRIFPVTISETPGSRIFFYQKTP